MYSVFYHTLISAVLPYSWSFSPEAKSNGSNGSHVVPVRNGAAEGTDGWGDLKGAEAREVQLGSDGVIICFI